MMDQIALCGWTETCGHCKHFLGCGDYNICCDVDTGLHYADSPVCDKFSPGGDNNEARD